MNDQCCFIPHFHAHALDYCVEEGAKASCIKTSKHSTNLTTLAADYPFVRYCLRDLFTSIVIRLLREYARTEHRRVTASLREESGHKGNELR